MKKHLVILILGILLISCLDKKKQDDNKLLGNEVVTFVINQFPNNHDYNKEIYISGDFEGWSGGREQFKLKKKNNNYSITIPKYRETINFKFTQGNWETVECLENGNPIENRTYAFTGQDEKVEVNIANWYNLVENNQVSTASKNVHVFAEDFEIPQLNRKRKVSVYLPPNYETSNKHYQVLYFQDGQNVFDVKTSYTGEWEVDETLNAMYNEMGFELIVVAIDHGGNKRLNEYSAWDHEKYGKGEGKLYLDFLVNNLKPEIDKTYRTKPDHNNTGIMGSSLGGLFAHYAAVKRPDVFGQAGVFSPSFWYAENGFKFTEEHPNNTKFYYLIGDQEGEEMVNNMNRMVELMELNGFSNIHKKIEPNGIHSESFWKTEFKQAISWLFINQ
ncbi:alpha/beta hydrolase [Jejuia spongiicola]|uniref:Alpha/beta hydrolase-fold protein n=1 Tax=Jejuia spongiicola TaxID=2942207 RepID=A0ABT0QIS8_9FLAO|nr:alpha/beta hydrolase-fold protein [Jejuia spongiicola]MCL6296378.1 alpha/beta hydrolase-fold protein [Jejuia spongiicola]